MEREWVELAVLQILFWAGVAFFLAARKNRPLHRPSSRFVCSLTSQPTVTTSLFAEPESGIDSLGFYEGVPIYRYVMIEGTPYQFDRLLLANDLVIMERGERCVAPGLVYRECRMPFDAQLT